MVSRLGVFARSFSAHTALVSAARLRVELFRKWILCHSCLAIHHHIHVSRASQHIVDNLSSTLTPLPRKSTRKGLPPTNLSCSTKHLEPRLDGSINNCDPNKRWAQQQPVLENTFVLTMAQRTPVQNSVLGKSREPQPKTKVIGSVSGFKLRALRESQTWPATVDQPHNPTTWFKCFVDVDSHDPLREVLMTTIDFQCGAHFDHGT